MKSVNILFIIISLIILSCSTRKIKNPADSIYVGGDIVTMKGDNAEYAEAVAVKGGKIQFAGLKKDAMKLKGDSTLVVDLQGKTMFPGFIDGHCHFDGFGAQAIAANLLASPDGNVNDIDALGWWCRGTSCHSHAACCSNWWTAIYRERLFYI